MQSLGIDLGASAIKVVRLQGEEVIYKEFEDTMEEFFRCFGRCSQKHVRIRRSGWQSA